MSHHDHTNGLTPEELLRWLRNGIRAAVLDEDSQALFSDFMYQVPYWERTGYWDLQQYYARHSGKPTAISAFSDFVKATVREVIGRQYHHLLSVALDVTPSCEIHGFHAFDHRSKSNAILLGAQLIMGLPRANMNFLHVLNAHQLRTWTGRYDAQSTQLQHFLGLKDKPDIGRSGEKGMLLQGDDDVAHASRLLATLARELFSEPNDMIPWMIEAEGIEWLVAAAFAQQLFIVLHEYGHANDAWTTSGRPVAHGLLVRGLSGEGLDLEAEDRADLWAAGRLHAAVQTGEVHLNNWDSDVPGFLKRERWPLPSDPMDLLAFALFLLFEHLHVSQCLGWLNMDVGYRPPRERYDRIAVTLGAQRASQSFMAEMRQLLDTLSTVAVFGGTAARIGM